MSVELRDIREADLERILRLNADVEVETSRLDLSRLRLLLGLSSYHKVAVTKGRVAAFLLAMRESAPYENDNHGWFRGRYHCFLYVDRIVVAVEFAGRRIGSALYADLFEFAREHGVPRVVCEYNLEPPNPASKAFHDAFGFRQVGSQHVAGGAKRVSLQAAAV